MSYGIGVEGAQSEVGSLVHEPAILSPYGEVFAQQEVCTSAVNERASRLTVGARHQIIAGRAEDESSTFCQHVRT